MADVEQPGAVGAERVRRIAARMRGAAALELTFKSAAGLALLHTCGFVVLGCLFGILAPPDGSDDSFWYRLGLALWFGAALLAGGVAYLFGALGKLLRMRVISRHVRALHDSMHPAAIAPLLEARRSFGKELREQADRALLEIMPGVTETDAGHFTLRDRNTIYNATLDSQNDVALLEGLLPAVGRIGGARELQAVELLAARTTSPYAPICREPHIQAAAVQAYEAISARLAGARLRETLLRPAEFEPATLLRIPDPGRAIPELLLRATGGVDDARQDTPMPVAGENGHA